MMRGFSSKKRVLHKKASVTSVKPTFTTFATLAAAITFLALALALQGCKGEADKGGVAGGEGEREGGSGGGLAQQPSEQEPPVQVSDAVKTAISDFVKANLKSQYWPGSFEAASKLTPGGGTAAMEGYYRMPWTKDGNKFLASGFFETQDSTAEYVRLGITTTSAVRTQDKIGAFLSLYMSQPPASNDFRCEQQRTFNLPSGRTLTASLFCNYINVKGDGEKNIITIVTSEDKTSLYACRIPEGSTKQNATNCYNLS